MSFDSNILSYSLIENYKNSLLNSTLESQYPPCQDISLHPSLNHPTPYFKAWAPGSNRPGQEKQCHLNYPVKNCYKYIHFGENTSYSYKLKHRPNQLNLSLYNKPVSPRFKLVNRQCIHSIESVSSLIKGEQTCTQYSKCSLNLELTYSPTLKLPCDEGQHNNCFTNCLPVYQLHINFQWWVYMHPGSSKHKSTSQ